MVGTMLSSPEVGLDGQHHVVSSTGGSHWLLGVPHWLMQAHVNLLINCYALR